ncbi:MAG TPA: rubrerythrin family protein [Thermoanaerobaculia bacterium]
MKRAQASLLTLIAILAAATIALGQSTTFKVRNVLDRSFRNEIEAAARYDQFAAKAAEEGYPGAASLFRAGAEAERVHARRFEQAMRERGVDVPNFTPAEVKIGTTLENLRLSASLEVSERDGIYREGIDAAREARDEKLSGVFDQTRDTEVEHANLMQTAARQLEQLRKPKAYHVCRECGYTTDVNLPMCVLCRSKKHPHTVE